MLPFNFDYFKPRSLNEAVELFLQLTQQGKQPMYLSGGTELITLGRIDLAYTEAVIDIKEIAECKVLQFHKDSLQLGSALSLSTIEHQNPFPLLTKVVSEVADHTAREKITIGGNICGQIFYREAVLPFLLCDSQVSVAGPDGQKDWQINDIFTENLRLKPGDILVHISTENRFLRAPYFAFKRRQQWDMGYPLITIAAIKIDGELRVAISGLCPFPFRSQEVERSLNKKELTAMARIEKAIEVMPKPILDDVEGSASYRRFVLRHLLMDVLAAL